MLPVFEVKKEIPVNMADLCVCCGSASPTFFFRSVATVIRPAVALQHCPICCLISQANRVDDFDPSMYEYYRSLLGLPIEQLYDPTNSTQIQKLLKGLKALLEPSTSSRNPKLLDVGCGIGGVVHVACSMGWKARGIDLSESAIQVGRSLGVPIDAVDLFDETILPESYDLIIMSEFIEHVPFPNRVLKRAETVLRPGGVLYFTTPNFDCLDRRLTGGMWRPIGSEHLFYFTPATCRELINRHTSFEIVKLQTKNFSPSILISWLKSLAARKAVTQGAPDDGMVVQSSSDLERNLRRTGAGSPIYECAKFVANCALNALGLGQTTAVTLRRPM